MWPFRSRKSPADRRLAFIQVLAGRDRGPEQTYRRYCEDPAATLEDIQDADDLPPRWKVEDAIFNHVLIEHRLVDALDWVADLPEVIEAFDKRLREAGKRPIGPADRDWIERYVDNRRPERGQAIGMAYGPLADSVETRGLRILDVQAFDDCYRFTLVTPEIAKAWIGVRLSDAFLVGDPSWQFQDVLLGSKFAQFLRPKGDDR